MKHPIRAIRARLARPQQPDENGLTPRDYQAAAAAAVAYLREGDALHDAAIFDDMVDGMRRNFRRSTTTPDGWAA